VAVEARLAPEEVRLAVNIACAVLERAVVVLVLHADRAEAEALPPVLPEPVSEGHTDAIVVCLGDGVADELLLGRWVGLGFGGEGRDVFGTDGDGQARHLGRERCGRGKLEEDEIGRLRRLDCGEVAPGKVARAIEILEPRGGEE
jgi:hypothetical protein